VRAPGVRLKGDFAHVSGWLFRNLDLTLVPGGWTCLLGPSGVGKTTVLRLLAGLDAGGVFTGDISTDDGGGLRQRVAYMAQSDLIPPWNNVRSAVMLGARLRGERPDFARADELIARVGLASHAGKRPAALSGGMRQRTALARTLMEERPVALLDEPFSALDAGTRAAMQELAFETLVGRTVLLVTHDPAEAARLGQRIYLMQETGLKTVHVSDTPPIRPIDDSETIRIQTHLLETLRGRVR